MSISLVHLKRCLTLVVMTFSVGAFALVNGVPMKESSDLVRLKFKKTGFICMGFFVNPVTILTAGHCLNDVLPESISLEGVNEGQFDGVKVIASHVHPKYVAKKGLKYDLAVIRTTTYSQFKGSYKIDPTQNRTMKKQTCTLHGAGKINVAKKVYGFSQGNNFCRTWQGRWLLFGKSKNTQTPGIDTMIAPNDSGGPMLDQHGNLIGVQTQSSQVWTNETIFPSWGFGVSVLLEENRVFLSKNLLGEQRALSSYYKSIQSGVPLFVGLYRVGLKFYD